MMIQIESDKILKYLARREVAVKLDGAYQYIRTINRNKIELVNAGGFTISINLSDVDDFDWYAEV